MTRIAPSQGRTGSPLPARLLGKAMALGYRITGNTATTISGSSGSTARPSWSSPSVFNPKLPRTGNFCAAKSTRDRASGDAGGAGHGHGLDVCSGICGALCAGRSSRSTSIPRRFAVPAINAAAESGWKHGSRSGMAICSAPVADERFDLVLFNPPFISGATAATTIAISAWRSSDVAGALRSGSRRALETRRLGVGVVVHLRRRTQRSPANRPIAASRSRCSPSGASSTSV